ncbi:MAG: DUF6817 domain-containing protein [Gammaproteobacteria bacterium]
MNRIDQALAKLSELGAHELKHINGDLAKHLNGTYNLLVQWGNPESLCMAGLYHAVYGTDGFPDQLVPLDQRETIATLVGSEAEKLVYFYGACDRSYFYQEISLGDNPSYRDRFTGETFKPTRNVVSSFCELTFANELEIASKTKAFFDQYPHITKLFNRFEGLVSEPAFNEYKKIFGVDT